MGSSLPSMASHPVIPLSFIPSPPSNGFHIGPLFIHYYGLMYVIGIALAILITQRRVGDPRGNPPLVRAIPPWAPPAGLRRGPLFLPTHPPHPIPPAWCGILPPVGRGPAVF